MREHNSNQVTHPLLEMKGIAKRFGSFYALQGVDLPIYRGEIHALMGENGAGKSTLMKILAGAYTASEGDIFIDGERFVISSPKDAIKAGITLIYQEIHLSPNLTVAENIFLGCEIKHWYGLDRKAMADISQKVLERLGAQFSATQKVSSLTIAEQQQVEIARALHRNSRVLVMDEPTAALSSRETERLFELVKKLRDEGMAIIYISHRMAEIYELADRVSVLRDGKYVGSLIRENVDSATLVQMMVGRPLTDLFNKKSVPIREEVLRVENLADGNKVRDASLVVRAGEIIGLSGLVGAGRSELAHLLFGVKRATQGKIYLSGGEISFNSPRDAIAHHVALLPENRKEEGLFLDLNILKNVTMATIERDATMLVINRTKGKRATQEAIEGLKMRVPSANVNVSGLSGGNQQKVLLSRWAAIHPKLFIMDEPTRGVDVGAKSEIYRMMIEMAKQGVAILMISSELPEIVGMSDRVYVMREGYMVGELTGNDINQEQIMAFACGAQ
ncbi:D-xylose ABC transporter ATP-binding protein [Rodentibacter caecimuris]|uniref:D-xylose ABC transporter ATP-binding protein n=1 Tax=Rodentibacter caecimuris TaxID=1796644 RepID=A0AAJ3K3H1_9PAST|nr:sugar ABC transporter ATP-binding protein [Rodentibacter heylii]AOF54378.1 ABC transport system, ATP-binding protein [Pasteurellaceae bacterium NI1060]OOF71772.1 D-xylose ABC transporter ATP-binding protein [Rodentibacter heylii]OOF72533.1 D-xylose ABC transporter ATP-binding protein [Rodentibacter heylii]OOF74369.1 D-xylose ABC transporter ATP-binding protein [Rodentibacter heylii]